MHITKMSIDSSKYIISTFMESNYFKLSFLLLIIVTYLLYILINFFITIFLTINNKFVSFLLIVIHLHFYFISF